jgi:hypothetical protein
MMTYTRRADLLSPHFYLALVSVRQDLCPGVQAVGGEAPYRQNAGATTSEGVLE